LEAALEELLEQELQQELGGVSGSASLPAAPASSEGVPPPPAPVDEVLSGLQKRTGRHVKWGHFKFIWKNAGAHGAIQATCPYHLGVNRQLCRKTMSVPSADSIGDVLLALKSWCVLALEEDVRRKWQHLAKDIVVLEPVDLENLLEECDPPEDVMRDDILDELETPYDSDDDAKGAGKSSSSSSVAAVDSSSSSSFRTRRHLET
jgi:hypothetical protein